MPAFSYQAIDPQGVTQRGVLEADSARAVRSQLRARHLVPLDVAPVVSGTQTRDIVLWQRRVLNQTALTIWTRQLAGLVDAGLPLERALTALADEAPTPRQQALVALRMNKLEEESELWVRRLRDEAFVEYML